MLISCAGKVSQVVFGMVDQTGVRANIVGGGIAEAGMHTMYLDVVRPQQPLVNILCAAQVHSRPGI